jgi:hypothetical protein
MGVYREELGAPSPPSASVELSSALTPIFKFFFPFLALFGLAISIFLRFWIITIPFAVAAVATILLASQLKRVFLNGDDLVLTNYFRSAQVPRTAIALIQERRLLSIRPVWIHFSTMTPFGRDIAFIPRVGIVPLWKTHPVVRLLRDNERE